MKKPIPVKMRTDYMVTKYSALTFRYSPSKFDGDILLFRMTGNNTSHTYNGWETLVNNIKLVEIEGKHLDIFIGESRKDILRKEIEKYLILARQ